MFTVAKGEVLVVIGPSGSGKLTMLRRINFLEEFEQGAIHIDGEPIGYVVDPSGRRVRQSEAEAARMRAEAGMAFQSYALFPHRSVLANVMMGPLHVTGMACDQAEPMARALLTEVGLAEKADQFARDLGDRFMFIDGGQIVEQGPPRDVLNNPTRKRSHVFLRRFTEDSYR